MTKDSSAEKAASSTQTSWGEVPTSGTSLMALKPVIEYLRGLGFSDNQFLCGAQLGESIEPKSAAELRLYGLPWVYVFWERAIQLTGDRAIALKAAQTMGPNSFGLFSYLMSSAPDLRRGLEVTQRFHSILCDIMELRVDPVEDFGNAKSQSGHQLLALKSEHLIPVDKQRATPSEYAIASFYNAIRQCLGQDWVAERVVFEHEEKHGADRAALDAFFGCPIEFGQDFRGIVFSSKDLGRRFVGADTSLHQIMFELAKDKLANYADRRVVPKPDFLTLTRQTARELLHEGELTSDDLAQRLGMSRRTLQRRLSKEGCTYRSLIERVQLELADEFLRTTSMKLAEIAKRTGFATSAGLHRAFQHWTGQTPAELRKALSAA